MALVAAEFLRSRLVPGATWGSIAYTQYGYLALMQVAAVVGIWGLTFLVRVVRVHLRDGVAQRGFDWSVVGASVLTCAVVLGTVLVGGRPESRRRRRIARRSAWRR